MAENKGYMQYAMLFGTYLGGYWILKFILFPLGLTIPFLSFLFVGLTLCVPFMGYYYVRMYRNTVDRKSTRLNSSHTDSSRMPSSA